MNMTLRLAEHKDLEAVVAIYNCSVSAVTIREAIVEL